MLFPSGFLQSICSYRDWNYSVMHFFKFRIYVWTVNFVPQIKFFFTPTAKKLSTQMKMLVFRCQSELERQFVAKLDGSMQICSQSRFRVEKYTKKVVVQEARIVTGYRIRIKGADKKCLQFSHELFSRQTCYYGFRKTNQRFWALPHCLIYWRTTNHRCCSFLRSSPFRNFTVMEIVWNGCSGHW